MVQFFGKLLLQGVLVGVCCACQGGDLRSLGFTGSGTLTVKKKQMKEQQIEVIKSQVVREGLATEQASALAKALAALITGIPS